MISLLNSALLKLSLRAETNDRSQLVETFVDVGALFTRLSSRDHQVLFGRRGTGKTHALSYLAGSVEHQGDFALLLDLRTIGSSGGTYADQDIPITERATRLIVDTLMEVHERLRRAAIERAEELDMSKIGPLLDEFAKSITEVVVVGDVEQKTASTAEMKRETVDEGKIGLSQKGLDLSVSGKDMEVEQRKTEHALKEAGPQRHRIHFGSVRNSIANIMDAVAPKKLWVLLDEWSEVPLDLQPYLADLLRRTLFPTPKVIVKIAAIEHRSQFRLVGTSGEGIGIEIGADAASTISLDDFMVFNNDSQRAKVFFANLLHKHLRAVWDQGTKSYPATTDKLVRDAFTQSNAFDEFVRASEGVPRDAIDIIGIAAEHADSELISIPNIRQAAKLRYQRGKEASIRANVEAISLLQWIIDEVIAHRQARAFLLRSDIKHSLIDSLFDARVLHVIKRGVSGRDEPGVRYDVYVIDFGCYVELINTSRAPQGLFEVDSDDGAGFIDVPRDDYRSIRRAILDLNAFEKRKLVIER